MKRLPALLALALWSLPGAQSQHQHSATPAASPHASGAVHLAAGGLEGLSGAAFERAYLSMMIEHHRAAVEMSRRLLPRLRDEQVREWAQLVIRSQESEVRELSAMLRDLRLGSADAVMTAVMARDMRGMLAAVARSPNAEEAFVTHMLDHHASGVLMATLALLRSDSDVIRLSAQGILRAQAEQMYQFRQWKPDS